MKLHVHRKLSTYNMLGKCQMQTQAQVHQRELLHLRTASTADTLLIDKISIASANCPQSVSKIEP